MLEVKSADEVKSIATKYLEKEYGNKLIKFEFEQVWREADYWAVSVNVDLKVRFASPETKTIKIQVDRNSGEVIGFS